MGSRRGIVAALLVAPPLVLSPAVRAEGHEPPRVRTPPAVDGILDDEAWRDALPVADFRQRFPVDGAPATQPTTVLVVYTRDTLYLGMRATDSDPAAIVATTMNRDDFSITADDQFAVAIDSYDDGLNGYWFSTNPLGARVDAQFSDEGALWESSWNGVWECAARVDSAGWTAELAIPFSTLRFRPGRENVMGMNFFRRVIRTNEAVFAPHIPLEYPYGSTNVSVSPDYVFRGISGSSPLRVRPYALTGVRSGDDEPGTEWDRDAGCDLRYDLTSSLAASLSLNTDFAQAEVDDRQLNLTRFPLFLPEKRDFFLENSGVFSFGVPRVAEVHFSRRIGLASGDGGPLEPARIRAGAKVTGKVGATDAGAMAVRADDAGGDDPEDFGVLRARFGVGSRSTVGAIATARRTAGRTDETHGVDAVWQAGAGGFGGAAAFAARTAPALRRAADARLGWLRAFRTGERTAFDVQLLDIGEEFDPAVGFVPQRGIRRASASLTVPRYFAGGRARRLVPTYEGAETFARDGGRRLDRVHGGRLVLEMQSEDRIEAFGAWRSDAVLADFAVFRGVVVPAARYDTFRGGAAVSTKPGRRLAGDLTLEAGELYDGDIASARSEMRWRAGRHWTVSQYYEISRVRLDGGRFTGHVTRTRLQWRGSTRLGVGATIQYDNASDRLALSLRAAYLFREGTELILAVDHSGDRVDLGRPLGERERTTALLKVTYLLLR